MTGEKPISVLIVDDSPVICNMLMNIVESSPEFTVVGVAHNGREAVEMNDMCQPDIITMDVHMPLMNGLEATRQIMSRRPVPIVIVTSSWKMDSDLAGIQAMAAGAVAVLEKPGGPLDPTFEEKCQQLLKTLALMAQVPMVRRKTHPCHRKSKPASCSSPGRPPQVVVVGASTGGPQALQALVSHLPTDFPLPVLIVQHISSGFTAGLVEWMNQWSPLPVHLATHRSPLRSGHIYVAPENVHLGFASRYLIRLSDDSPIQGHRPSVTYLFQSAASTFEDQTIAVLLTGMGKDGAEAMAHLRRLGAVTFAQSKETCVVFGMPGEAVKLDAAQYVLSPEEIAKKMRQITAQLKPERQR